jgi:hypothetical protein
MFNYVLGFFCAWHGGDFYQVGEVETDWFHLRCCFVVELPVVHDLDLFVIILCIYYCCFVIRIDLLIKTRVLLQCHTRKEITTHNYVSDAYSI